MTVLDFRVIAAPATQGSHRIGRRGRGKQPIVIHDNDPALRAWRSAVALAAIRARREAGHRTPARDVPIAVTMTFCLPRPASHYRTGKHAGELRPDAPLVVTTRPDVDKLTRSTLDALTEAGVWADDSQVQLRAVLKIYDDKPGVAILVEDCCRFCGCTDQEPCDVWHGGDACHWTAPGVCSYCPHDSRGSDLVPA